MAEEFVLHSYRRCPFAMRTRVVLELKKIPYRVIEERLGDWTEFLQKNVPRPKVPILVHNGRIIRESNDINAYLDRLYPQPALVPSDKPGQDDMHRWWDWCDNLFKPAVDQYKYKPDKSFHQAGKIKIERLLATLENELKKGRNLCGESLTLADIAIIPFVRQVMRVRHDPVDWAAYPRLGPWADQVLRAPYFEKQVMKKYPFAKSKNEKSS